MTVKELSVFLGHLDNQNAEIGIEITDEENNVSLGSPNLIRFIGNDKVILSGNCEDYITGRNV